MTFNNLISDIRDINERVMTGDYCSASHAIRSKWFLSIISQAKKDLEDAGYKSTYLSPYVAAGGWVGIGYSFFTPSGEYVQGSMTPRRINR